MEKCEYLARILDDQDIDIALLQETHLTESSKNSRHRVPGYVPIQRLDHHHHGVMVITREGMLVDASVSHTGSEGSQWISVVCGETTIRTVNTPPSQDWEPGSLPGS